MGVADEGVDDKAGIMIEFLRDVKPDTRPLPVPESADSPKVLEAPVREILFCSGDDCPELGVDGIVTAAVVEGESYDCGLNRGSITSLVGVSAPVSDGASVVETNSLIASSSGTTGSTAAAFWDFGPHRRFLGSAASVLIRVNVRLDSTEAGSVNDGGGSD